MNPCERCRHSFVTQDGLRCGKRFMQQCRHAGDVQFLEMVPGLCPLLNPNDDCAEFKPKLLVRLRDALGRFR